MPKSRAAQCLRPGPPVMGTAAAPGGGGLCLRLRLCLCLWRRSRPGRGCPWARRRFGRVFEWGALRHTMLRTGVPGVADRPAHGCGQRANSLRPTVNVLHRHIGTSAQTAGAGSAQPGKRATPRTRHRRICLPWPSRLSAASGHMCPGERSQDAGPNVLRRLRSRALLSQPSDVPWVLSANGLTHVPSLSHTPCLAGDRMGYVMAQGRFRYVCHNLAVADGSAGACTERSPDLSRPRRVLPPTCTGSPAPAPTQRHVGSAVSLVHTFRHTPGVGTMRSVIRYEGVTGCDRTTSHHTRTTSRQRAAGRAPGKAPGPDADPSGGAQRP